MPDELRFLVDAAPEAEWEVWCEDTFDLTEPRRVETAGQGLAAGLAELWERHLFETVQPEGAKGFLRFNLWWKQAARSIEVVGDWGGMIKLRWWVFGARRWAVKGGLLGAESRGLLMSLGAVHSCLSVAGETSAAMLEEVVASAGLVDLEDRLSKLASRALDV